MPIHLQALKIISSTGECIHKINLFLKSLTLNNNAFPNHRQQAAASFARQEKFIFFPFQLSSFTQWEERFQLKYPPVYSKTDILQVFYLLLVFNKKN